MANKISGHNGQVKLCTTGGAPAEMIEVTNWKKQGKSAILDITGMSSGGKRQVMGGITEFSASVSGKWDKTEAKGVGAPPVIVEGAVVDFKLYPDDTLTNLHWDGSGVVESVDVDCPYDGVLTWEMTIQGSATLTHPTANT